MGVSRIILLALVAGIGSTPFASAYDPFYDQICRPQLPCLGVGMCVANFACVPRGCDVLVSCRGAIGPVEEECAVNQTIAGRTCTAHAGFDVDAGSGTRAGFMASVSNGSVQALNLFNTWTSPGVEADAAVLGVETGRAFASVYRSDVLSEGPRGGPLGRILPAENHTWTQIGAAAGIRDGPSAVVGIEFLDLMPEGCFVRSPTGGVPELQCPSLAPFYPLIALP